MPLDVQLVGLVLVGSLVYAGLIVMALRAGEREQPPDPVERFAVIVAERVAEQARAERDRLTLEGFDRIVSTRTDAEREAVAAVIPITAAARRRQHDAEPLALLRHHVSGAVERGEAEAITERRCYCPDDCRCHRESNPPCGCQQHEGDDTPC